MSDHSSQEIEEMIERVRGCLSDDLLRPQFVGLPWPTGHCYVASEALWWLLSGSDSLLEPVRARGEDGVVHWWLQDEVGNIYDPTGDQYEHNELISLHRRGKAGGFLTNVPSKRARILMNCVRDLHNVKPHVEN